MNFRLETIAEKKLVGKRLRMSLVENKTRELWQSFMPRRNEIANATGTDLYSLQDCNTAERFARFDPALPFDKLALMEVASTDALPDEMEAYTLPGGLYAVFEHKGPPSAAGRSFQYILGTWLPTSGYQLDSRPHFEVLGEKYKNEHPDSEEEIWIPIRKP